MDTKQSTLEQERTAAGYALRSIQEQASDLVTLAPGTDCLQYTHSLSTTSCHDTPSPPPGPSVAELYARRPDTSKLLAIRPCSYLETQLVRVQQNHSHIESPLSSGLGIDGLQPNMALPRPLCPMLATESMWSITGQALSVD